MARMCLGSDLNEDLEGQVSTGGATSRGRASGIRRSKSGT